MAGGSTTTERAASREHFIDLCRMLADLINRTDELQGQRSGGLILVVEDDLAMALARAEVDANSHRALTFSD